MRRAKLFGLERAYRSSEFVNATIRRLFGLAFVDTTEVHSAVRAVESAIEQFQDSAVRDRLSELMRYFNTTWMVKFKPDEWNQLQDVALRTNNWSEAFHAAFSRRFARAHPNVRVVVKALKKVESQTRVMWNEFKHNPHGSKR